MISNFISDLVNSKFLKFARAKFPNQFLQNAWEESNFQLKIRIQRKISRRRVRVDIVFVLTLPTFRMKIVIA